LRIITSTTITAQQVALAEGCDIRTARAIVQNLNGEHRKGTAYTCNTDAYLERHRGTNRLYELSLIYGGKQQ